MANKTSKAKVRCNQCGATTNHETMHSVRTEWEDVIDEDADYSIYGWDRWDTMKCLGCDSVLLRHASQFSEDSDERGGPVTRYKFYPPRLTRTKPDWSGQFLVFDRKLEDLKRLIDEIYSALGERSCRLAAMGIRALVEQVMIDKVGDQGRFDQNIKAFFDAGYVAPTQQATFKETLIEAGHAAMHRGFNPSSETIETLLGIVEPLIDDIYFKPHRSKKAAKDIPKREALPPEKAKSKK